MNDDRLFDRVRTWSTIVGSPPYTRGEELQWAERHLPPEPLPDAVLRRVLDPQGEYLQAVLLCLLARVGRTEVLPFLRERLRVEGNAGNRLALAEGLALLSEAEGLAALEALFRDSKRHQGDPDRSVPLFWITHDILRDELGTPAALALSEKLND